MQQPPMLHLGHVQNFILLEKFREVGAKITILFGDFTGQIGDPTDKVKARKNITDTEAKQNISGWKKQIAPVIKISGFGSASINYNSNWYSKMKLATFLGIAKKVTLQHLLERDMFEKRIGSGDPIYLHEFLYPILQGYDSVSLEADAEMCGTDQTFNALVGRDLAKKFLGKDKFVIVNNLVEDMDTGKLMSKSEGYGVFIDMSPDGARNMFGKVMSLPDGFIEPLFINCTTLDKEYT